MPPLWGFQNTKRRTLNTLSYTALQAYRKQLLSFNGEFHGQLIQNFPRVSVNNQADGCFSIDSPLIAVEDLIFADPRGCSFMFQHRRLVFDFNVRKCMCTALITH